MTVFNSRDPRYRTPVGAVPAGSEVRFTVRPESFRFPLRGFLCTRAENNGEIRDYEMTHNGSEDHCEIYNVSIRLNGAAGLVWYYFRFENEGGFFFYGKDPLGMTGNCTFYGAITPEAYQLTVYDGSYSAPEWFGQGVCYHIFPDRFFRTEIPEDKRYSDRERLIHKEWDDTPYYRPESNGKITNRDFFGGNLEGIRSKLSYLQSLGVTCIYLSPIFEAYSNHRYDTADYSAIDPMLGGIVEFKNLCKDAETRGIRIILDGVFNHTGYDSIYFNGKGRYPSVGAAQSMLSPYYTWYHFDRWPDEYACWWDIRTLPQTNKADSEYTAFIAQRGDSIVRRWLKAGASGWRLDVADELPDAFIEEINRAARAEKDDALILGEVWEDASNKISYGARRKYILGEALDGVMNYPFRTAVIEFLKGGTSSMFRGIMESLLENYPPYAIRSAMNLLGTHDTPRIISILGVVNEQMPHEKEDQAQFLLDEKQRKHAIEFLKIGALIQYSFIGCPCVYYGDEAGMEGLDDPLNRRGYIWGKEDKELVSWYKRLGEARKSLLALREGTLVFLNSDEAVVAFERKMDENTVIAACNRDDHPITLSLSENAAEWTDFMSGEIIAKSLDVVLQPRRAYLLIKNPSGRDEG